jgi:hypothetical protein
MATEMLSAAAMAEWLRVLDRVQEALEQALADADVHDRAAAAPRPADDGPARRALGRIDDCLAGLRERLAAAGGVAAELEQALAADESAVRAWQAAATVAAERLGAAARLR